MAYGFIIHTRKYLHINYVRICIYKYIYAKANKASRAKNPTHYSGGGGDGGGNHQPVPSMWEFIKPIIWELQSFTRYYQANGKLSLIFVPQTQKRQIYIPCLLLFHCHQRTVAPFNMMSICYKQQQNAQNNFANY